MAKIISIPSIACFYIKAISARLICLLRNVDTVVLLGPKLLAVNTELFEYMCLFSGREDSSLETGLKIAQPVSQIPDIITHVVSIAGARIILSISAISS